MIPLGTTNCKSGNDIPQVLKWMYVLELKYGGFVTSSEISFDVERCIKRYTIRSPIHKLEIMIDQESGFIEGRLNINRERTYQPIYEIGNSQPSFVPGMLKWQYPSKII
ncbi:hypothetical protein LCGC14_2024520 [marine sediment metagenome]|uniref:Uncharacterized protein n=1 Tax=marine sediment metagenome TaxID=412755 RepID=A0A0F9FJ17_9ZZZZ